MQLDTAIEQRKREINNVSNDINGEKDNNEANGQQLRQKKIDLLNTQLDRSKVLFQERKFKMMGTRYNEIATSKYSNPKSNYLFSIGQFDSQIPADQAGAVLEQEKNRNQTIENVINEARQQNPAMDEILAKLIEW